MNIIETKNLKINVNNDYFIDNISFSVSEGDTLVLYSNEHEGSQLLKAIYLEKKPVDGEIYYFDELINKYNRNDIDEWHARDISYIDKNDYLFFNLSIKENITLPQQINRVEIDKAYFNEVIKTLDIATLLDKYPIDLNPYERKKISIARAIISRPFILLIDNAFEFLTKPHQDEIFKMLNTINSMFHIAMFHTTTNINMLKYATKKFVIEEGILSEL
ncbi:ATP-binding cassette domain-containing protein [bacterium]|nr:ATP-binding cassette domain-containing protein [bacterium]